MHAHTFLLISFSQLIQFSLSLSLLFSWIFFSHSFFPLPIWLYRNVSNVCVYIYLYTFTGSTKHKISESLHYGIFLSYPSMRYYLFCSFCTFVFIATELCVCVCVHHNFSFFIVHFVLSFFLSLFFVIVFHERSPLFIECFVAVSDSFFLEIIIYTHREIVWMQKPKIFCYDIAWCFGDWLGVNRKT